MDAQPDCGLAGCRLYHEDGRDAFPARRFQTLPVILARRCGLGRLMPRVVDRYLYRQRDRRTRSSAIGSPAASSGAARGAGRRRALSTSASSSTSRTWTSVSACSQAGWRVMYHGGTYCYHLEQRASARLFSADAWRHLLAYARWLRKWGCRPEGTGKASATRRASLAPLSCPPRRCGVPCFFSAIVIGMRMECRGSVPSLQNAGSAGRECRGLEQPLRGRRPESAARLYARRTARRHHHHRHPRRPDHPGRPAGAGIGAAMQCPNNLHQLGIAIAELRDAVASLSQRRQLLRQHYDSDYHYDGDGHGTMQENWVFHDPAVHRPGEPLQPVRDQRWHLQPHSYNPPLAVTTTATTSGGTAVQGARAFNLPFMLCPSDSYTEFPYLDANGGPWARGNYAANGGLVPMTVTVSGTSTTAGTDIGSAGGPSELGWLNPTTRGIMGVNCSLRSADITDGASNTILLGEIRAGISSATPAASGRWAAPSQRAVRRRLGLGRQLQSHLGQPGRLRAQLSPRQTVRQHGELQFNPSGYNTLTWRRWRCPVIPLAAQQHQQTIRSMHRSGGHICLADGSVRWISDNIRTQAASVHMHLRQRRRARARLYSVWDRLIAVRGRRADFRRTVHGQLNRTQRPAFRTGRRSAPGRRYRSTRRPASSAVPAWS